MAYARRDIRGGAVQTTISGAISDTAVSCSIAATTGWPDGGVGSFYVVIDPGTASEEKILCSTRSASTVNFTTRGTDGSTAYAHAGGAVIYPIFTAVDADEANKTVSETVGKVTTSGDLLVASGANAFNRLAKGSNSTVLNTSSGGTVGWGTVTSAMITDGTIVAGDIADGTITQAKLAAGVGGDSWTTVRKASNESVTSSTVIQNDDELFFTAANGTPYIFECVIVYASPTGAAVPDIKGDFGEDTGVRGAWFSYQIGTADSQTSSSGLTDQGNAGTFWGGGTAVAKRIIPIYGSHVGAGGTFRVRWAQGTSDSNATTVYAGSYLRYKTVT